MVPPMPVTPRTWKPLMPAKVDAAIVVATVVGDDDLVVGLRVRARGGHQLRQGALPVAADIEEVHARAELVDGHSGVAVQQAGGDAEQANGLLPAAPVPTPAVAPAAGTGCRCWSRLRRVTRDRHVAGRGGRVDAWSASASCRQHPPRARQAEPPARVSAVAAPTPFCSEFQIGGAVHRQRPGAVAQVRCARGARVAGPAEEQAIGLAGGGVAERPGDRRR